MSQVEKSASAFVRAFLAILVLELEDMVVRLVRPPKFAGVDGYRWTVRLGFSVDAGVSPPLQSYALRVPPWYRPGEHGAWDVLSVTRAESVFPFRFLDACDNRFSAIIERRVGVERRSFVSADVASYSARLWRCPKF
jgi:hypothetical protein